MDLVGQRFERLTVIERTENKGSKAAWKCKCDCGGFTVAVSHDLISGHTKSCGCFQREQTSKASIKHGKRHIRLYSIWLSMKDRCFNPKNKRFCDWGGRGITVCDEWKNNFQSFYDYVSVLPHYNENGYSLDRINNDGNYEPGNVKWSTASEQNKNKRSYKKEIIMELKMDEYQLPESISFNYEELKTMLKEKVNTYETLVYSDEQINLAKKDKANLNKLKEALNDERIRREREYMEPFNDFKAKINELIKIIDEPVKVIDKQIKSYDEQKKQEKQDKIIENWKQTDKPDWLSLAMIENAKWLNASVSMKSIQKEISAKVEQIKNDLATLQNLPEFGFEAVEIYKSTLDVNRALNEAQKMSQIAKAKAEHEAEEKARAEERARLEAEEKARQEAEAQEVVQEVQEIAQEVVQEQIPGQVEFTNNETFEECIPKVEEQEALKQWVGFYAFLSNDDALALKQFFDSRNIEFKPV